MIVIDAEAAAKVDVLEVEAIFLDLLHKADHDFCRIPEDTHLSTSQRATARSDNSLTVIVGCLTAA